MPTFQRFCLGAASVLTMAGLTLPASAQGVTLPGWRIPDICAKESAPGQCAAFEGRARQSISASWTFLLDPIKTECLRQLSNPLDQSWRELADCIDLASTRALDKAAVKTSRTPGEPVPPARVPAPMLAPDLAPQPPTPATNETAPAVKP